LGKTTTKDMLAAALAGRYVTEKAPASFNNALGVPLTIFRAGPRTEVLVSELGANHPGEIAHLARMLAPTAGIITSIAAVHLEGFGTIDGVIEAKGELAAALPPDGVLYLAGGMPGLSALRARARCLVKLFGPGTDTQGMVTATGPDGLTVRVGDHGEFFLPSADRQHLAGAVAAIAVALDVGLTAAEIRRGLQRFRMPPLRWQREEVGGSTFVLDCYNANPASVRGALEAASAIAGASRRLITVLGDMRELGSASGCYHRELGETLAATSVAKVFLCGEEVAATREALERSSFRGEVGLFSDRDQLAREIARTIAPGDVIVFKASRTLKLEEVARKVKETVTN
jgi:UDP-N-acetylmuramoyl-tripeptide--D-alanyl-D-alanine ligase